jgi:battenin
VLTEHEAEASVENNMCLTWTTFRFIISKVGFSILFLFLVYFLEYGCTTVFADTFTRKMKSLSDKDKGWLQDNAFIILGFCYQSGVFVSRSSLEYVKIKKVWLFSAIQAINFVLWWTNAELFVLKNYYVWFIAMFWTGLLGGGAYVNIMYQIRNSK